MMLRNTFVQVSLGALRRNIRAARAYLDDQVKLMLVVKADAYGHGILPVARIAQEEGADWLGVAIAEEGIQLREAGIGLRILVFGALNLAGMTAAASHRLTVALPDVRSVHLAQQAAKACGVAVDAHIKLDTGMNRIGARSAQEVEDILLALGESPDVRLNGVFTHFAHADSPDPGYTDMQLARLRAMLRPLPTGVLVHAAATAAATLRTDTHFDMIRLGIGLYGYPPAGSCVRLEPSLRMEAEVSFVKRLEAGEKISYGCTYEAQRPMVVATLAVGYGDGVSRALSNRGQVLLHGVRCPMVGRICMDQLMVDASAVPQVIPGDRAVLLGTSGDDRIGADEVAGWIDTISYEVLLSPSARVPRLYTE